MSMIHGASVKTLYGGLYAYTGARNWNWVGNFKSAYFCPVNYFDRFKSIPQENQKMKSQNFFCIVLGGFDTCFISAFKATFEFNVGERAIWRSNFCANRKLLDLKLPIYNTFWVILSWFEKFFFRFRKKKKKNLNSSINAKSNKVSYVWLQ